MTKKVYPEPFQVVPVLSISYNFSEIKDSVRNMELEKISCKNKQAHVNLTGEKQA